MSAAPSAHSALRPSPQWSNEGSTTGWRTIAGRTETTLTITIEGRGMVGDVNADGKFNSSDLLTVFQSGEYEDDIALNSTFEEGDWNGDGDFDSNDLVLALQKGTYGAAAVDRVMEEY